MEGCRQCSSGGQRSSCASAAAGNPAVRIPALRRPSRAARFRAAAIHLLLLTGCRKSEILTLHWSDYREGHLFLRDSKTGPRTVWLSTPVFPELTAFSLGPGETALVDGDAELRRLPDEVEEKGF